MNDEADFPAVEPALQRWMQAWVEQDHATLDALLASDYTLVVSTIPTLPTIPTRPFSRANWFDTAVGPYVCTRYDMTARACAGSTTMSW